MTQEAQPATERAVAFTVNGRPVALRVSVRTTLADLLREALGLTGTHLGCEHGVCGACTVLLDGEPVRACLLLAVQADGGMVTTVEGLGAPDALHPIQEAFWQAHGLQCGFCTPGILMTVAALLARSAWPTDAEIEEALGGHLCRCTGYVNILRAVRLAAEGVAAGSGDGRRLVQGQAREESRPAGGGDRV